jgi:hypothetical protein
VTRPRHLLRVEPLEDRSVPAVFHVSASGLDTNPGTAAAPWKTLQYAANTVNPGDTVNVAAGNYAGFNLTRSGTAAARITFAGVPGQTKITAANPWNNLDGINLEEASYVTVQGFTVNNMPRTGIRAVANDFVVIRNNSMDANGRWGILTGFSDDLVIENNVTTRSGAEHGIYVSNSGDRPVIRGNVSWGNRACGIHMNGDLSMGSYGVTDGDGIISRAVVENNVLYDNGVGGGSGINCDGVQDSTIRNNLIYNTHASGISLYQWDGGEPSKRNVVVNNTVLVSATGRWAMNIMNGSTNNTVRNNILFSGHSFRGAMSAEADCLPGLVSDSNVVESKFSTDGGGTGITLAQWRAQTGNDTRSIAVSDPNTLFVNAAAGNYHLKPGSVAIDRGSWTNVPKTDYEGQPRPMGRAPDIGHDEFYVKPGGGPDGGKVKVVLDFPVVPPFQPLDPADNGLRSI